MPDFTTAHAFVEHWEGGYSNDAADRGGECIFGIARKHHPDWLGWIEIDAGQYSMERLRELACELYEREYWAPLRASDFPQQRLATIVYQAAVNCGVKRASRWLQECLLLMSRGYMATDGIIGPKTLAKLNACRELNVLGDDVLDKQEEHYEALAQNDPTQRKFLQGWKNRVKAARNIPDE